MCKKDKIETLNISTVESIYSDVITQIITIDHEKN